MDFVNSIYSHTSWSDLYTTHIQNIADSHGSLENLTISIFKSAGVHHLNIAALERVVTEVKNKYNSNPYHNFEHACHVILNCGYFLYSFGTKLSSLEKASLLYAALIHDVEHLGVPNVSLVKKNHELAILYHDQSVAEMNSIAVGLQLFQNPHFDIFTNLSDSERSQFRQNVIELVLSTDIADPYRRKRTFARIEENSTSTDGSLDISTDMGKQILLSLVLRAADIGSSFQNFVTSKTWAQRYYTETNAWLLSDGRAIFTRELFFSDQISHMDNYVGNIVERLTTTKCIEDSFIATLQANFTANKNGWIKEGNNLLELWERDFRIAYIDCFPVEENKKYANV